MSLYEPHVTRFIIASAVSFFVQLGAISAYVIDLIKISILNIPKSDSCHDDVTDVKGSAYYVLVTLMIPFWINLVLIIYRY